MPTTRSLVTLALLRLIQGWDRMRLRRLERRYPGLKIHPRASTNLASARIHLAPGATLTIGPDVATERNRGELRIELGAGAKVSIEAGTWLRSDLFPVTLHAFDGAEIRIGRKCFVNGCMLSAKKRIVLGDYAMVGMGSRIFDSDQHPIDADRPELSEPVHLDEYTWIAADVTILRGVTIGAHSIVGTRSLVRRDVPPHSLAAGVPAEVHGKVGDRSGLDY